MPISGRFWRSTELQEILGGVSKQRISNLAAKYGWHSPHPGLYLSGSGDDTGTPDAYLFARWRADIADEKNPIWDDSFDMDCPECGAFAIEVEGGWKCVKGHSGGIE